MLTVESLNTKKNVLSWGMVHAGLCNSSFFNTAVFQEGYLKLIDHFLSNHHANEKIIDINYTIYRFFDHVQPKPKDLREFGGRLVYLLTTYDEKTIISAIDIVALKHFLLGWQFIKDFISKQHDQNGFDVTGFLANHLSGGPPD